MLVSPQSHPVLTWANGSAPGGAGNTTRGLTLCGQPTLHVELVPLADLPPEPMLWCPTCLGRYLTALGSADAVLREVAA